MVDPLKYDCYIFDLDGTLYREEDYLFAAYKIIAWYIGASYGLKRRELYRYLIRNYEKNGRFRLLSRFLIEYRVNLTELGHIMELLRNVRTKLYLFPEMKSLLAELVDNGKQIIIATNGNREQQQNKLRQLDFGGLVDHIDIYFTNKPSVDGFECPDNSLMIGNEDIDREFAKNLGIDCILV